MDHRQRVKQAAFCLIHFVQGLILLPIKLPLSAGVRQIIVHSRTLKPRTPTSRDALSKVGYAPIVTGDPEEVTHLVEEEEPHLVLLDLMLPGSDGIKLMKDILEIADVPVIFLSVYGKDELVARVLDMGAADYVVKPFSPMELTAKIRAALRKGAAPGPAVPADPYLLGDLSVDYALHKVTVAGRPVDLTDIEYRMLVELSVNAGRVLTHDQLLQRLWHGEVRGLWAGAHHREEAA